MLSLTLLFLRPKINAKYNLTTYITDLILLCYTHLVPLVSTVYPPRVEMLARFFLIEKCAHRGTVGCTVSVHSCLIVKTDNSILSFLSTHRVQSECELQSD